MVAPRQGVDAAHGSAMCLAVVRRCAGADGTFERPGRGTVHGSHRDREEVLANS